MEAKKKLKKGYWTKTNLIKDENGDQVSDSQNILSGWKNYFCQL
jgi:hypothetical protein